MEDAIVPTSAINELEAALAERDARIARQDETTRALLDRLRRVYLDAEPSLDVALLTGETLEDLEASHNTALALIARARATIVPGAAVPAGSPSRVVAPPVTAFEKIRSGLAGLAR